jgi:RimJ/RimL family protein N-acetyltransferase
MNDRKVSRTTGQIPYPYTIGHAEAFILRSRQMVRNGDLLGLIMTDKQTGELLGGIGLREFNWSDMRATLGYWVASAKWGNGYASEATSAICHEAFRRIHLHRIDAETLTSNIASGIVLSRVGFVREGRRRERIQKGQKWLDTYLYGLLARDFHPYRWGGVRKTT